MRWGCSSAPALGLLVRQSFQSAISLADIRCRQIGQSAQRVSGMRAGFRQAPPLIVFLAIAFAIVNAKQGMRQ